MENEIEYKGYKIIIEQDTYIESPRDWDNLGIFAMAHKRYNFADKGQNFNSWEALEQSTIDAAVKLPVYMYDHSGVTINTTGFSCRWDSGQIGYIYATGDAIKKEFGDITPDILEKVKSILEGEIKTLDQYLTGDVYHYNVKNNGQSVDGCGGFYGYDDCLKEAKNAADWHFKENYPVLAAN